MDFNETINEPVVIERTISNFDNLMLEKHYTNFKRFGIYYTEPSIESESDKVNSRNDIQTSEKILNQLRGFIESIDENSVKIKFANDLIVNFPKILFKDQKLISFGKSLLYCIKTDAKGYRYQDFSEDEILEDTEKDKLIEQVKKL